MTVIYVKDSSNSKLGKGVDATYAPISTCPDTCTLKGDGCYAELGYVGIITNRLKKSSHNLTSLHLAQREARKNIESNSENNYLRIHVSGDFKTVACAEVVNHAVGIWKKNKKVVWTYTHNWKLIPRQALSNISVLASVSNADEVNQARERGYASAIIVDSIDKKVLKIEGTDTKFIACRAQMEDITCVECKICFDANTLHKKNFGVAFEAHGSRKDKIIKNKLTVVYEDN